MLLLQVSTPLRGRSAFRETFDGLDQCLEDRLLEMHIQGTCCYVHRFVSNMTVRHDMRHDFRESFAEKRNEKQTQTQTQTQAPKRVGKLDTYLSPWTQQTILRSFHIHSLTSFTTIRYDFRRSPEWSRLRLAATSASPT